MTAQLNTKKSILPLLFSEMIGTALLVMAGLSIVIFFWGKGSVMIRLIPNEALRRAVTGFLFGTTGCLISISRVGKISGAHINPAVSFAFWLRGKMQTNAMLGYMLSQLAGAAIGSVFLLLWGVQGRSIDYGNTVPGSAGVAAAFAGELLCSAALVAVIFVFAGKEKLKRFTPYTIPFLYCVMVCLESPYSGCSTNPARSFGPALISCVYSSYWLYWLAPLTGALVVAGLFSVSGLRIFFALQTARVSHHDSPTHECLRAG